MLTAVFRFQVKFKGKQAKTFFYFIISPRNASGKTSTEHTRTHAQSDKTRPAKTKIVVHKIMERNCADSV